MISAVYDTNVIVAGLLNPDGLTASLLDLATQDRVRLFVSPALIAEYRMVLLRPKFSLSEARVETFLRTLRARSQEVHPAFTLTVLRDPADNRVLECAVAARVDYLVTGNTRHFAFRSFRGVKITSPRRFWEAYVTPISSTAAAPRPTLAPSPSAPAPATNLPPVPAQTLGNPFHRWS